MRRFGVLVAVLVFGLIGAQSALAAGGSWSNAASLPNAVLDVAAAPVASSSGVADADVLVTGNVTSQIYDPTTNAWTQAATVPDPRSFATAASLDNGDVLVTSGHDHIGVTGDTEIYDPTTNMWTEAAPLPDPRYAAVAAPLGNGHVLVTSGYDENGEVTGDTEIYDPTTNAWTQAAALPDARAGAVAAPLSNGDVLVTSGQDSNGDTGDTEIYDPTTNTWTQAAALPDPRLLAVAAPLGNGEVLVTSGEDSNGFTGDTEIYDPVTNTWTQSPALPHPRDAAVAAALPNGGALVTGGSYSNFAITSDSEVFAPDPTQTSVSCAPGSVLADQATTCTATVTDTASSPSNPTGTIKFYANRVPSSFANSNPCTLAPVSGSGSQSSCQVSFTPGLGQTQDTVTGYYQPAGGYAAGHGSSSSIAVSARRSKTTLSCQPQHTAVGNATQCTATVTDASGAGQPQPPSGTVTFTAKNPNDTFTPGSCTLTPGSGASSSCAVSYTPTGPVGLHVVSGHYGGDPAYHGSTGNTPVFAFAAS